MVNTVRKALRLAGNRDRTAFDRNEELQLALTHLIQTIGEAARHVSKSYCEKHPEIPWANIVGMRHKVVHDYLSVDLSRVWETVAIELPDLLGKLEKLESEKK
ncbi:MAG: DUF86 domain-containing protein [Planctomycetes bacterium]|nr:DUF86 domain-containing protein [Planctomycetota bacterium]